jgi:hypothetical protein
MAKQARSIHSESVMAAGAIAECRAVGFDGLQASVQGQKVMGVANRSAPINTYVDVTCIGTAVIEAGAAFAAGAALIVDATGRAIAASALAVAAGATAMQSTAANGAVLTGSVLPEYVFADALRAAGGAGEFVEVLLRR